ncbi:MAG: hypothetical protein Q8R13_03530 [bacterium]|nr:hypothetical protein [bacterium]MDZ4296443.1 hypothetical protein [Patescibacteria group bacterium]
MRRAVYDIDILKGMRMLLLAGGVVFLLFPLAASSATPYLTLSAFTGPPGLTVVASGGGWNAGETLTFYFEKSPDQILATTAASSTGAFGPVRITIPLNAGEGVVTVVAKGMAGDQRAINTYFVQPFTPIIEVVSHSNTPLSAIAVRGAGFAANEEVRITLEGASATAQTDRRGSFGDTPLNIPRVPSGTYQVHAAGLSSEARTSSHFYIGDFFPGIAPSDYFLMPGQALGFSGWGFAPREEISVRVDHDTAPIASIVADTRGSFTAAGTTTIPFSLAGGQHTFHLSAPLGKSPPPVVVEVGSLRPQLSPSSYFIRPGETIRVTCYGFSPSETVAARIGEGPLKEGVADKSGNVTIGPLAIPFSGAPAVTIHAQGRSSSVIAALTLPLAAYTPNVTASTYYALPGDELSFSEGGFAPDETVRVFAARAHLATLTADSGGNLPPNEFTIPFGAKGEISYTFQGTQSRAATAVAIGVGSFTPVLEADTYYALPGSTIRVRASGFAKRELLALVTQGFRTTTTTSATGTTSPVALPLPLETTSAVATITASGASSGAAASLEVGLQPFQPQVAPSAYHVMPGSKVTFAGSGFAGGETLAIAFNERSIGTPATEPDGTFSAGPVTVPYNIGPAARFTFTGGISKKTVAVDVSVAALHPTLVLDNYYARGGSALTLNGMGFGPNEPVLITFNGTPTWLKTTDGQGSFTIPSSVPFAAAGEKPLDARGIESGASASAAFTQASFSMTTTLESYALGPGSAVTFKGSGYFPGEPVSITTDRTGETPAHRFAADAMGAFTNSGFTIPADWREGNLTFTLTGQYSMSPRSLTMYVTRP